MDIWNYISAETSKLETLLESSETTLEEVLDDESVISEMKNLNHKLMEYMTPEKILEMLNFVVEEPPENCSELRGYKLPFVASELFVSDVSVIYYAFFPVEEAKEEFGDYQEAAEGNEKKEEEVEKVVGKEDSKEKEKEISAKLLSTLFNVIESEKLNPVLVGYFAKIIQAFINKNPYEVYYQFT